MSNNFVLSNNFDDENFDDKQAAEVTPLSPNAEQMQSIFEEIECNLPFREDDSFKGMLTFAQNLEIPVHRWYYFKEGYSHQLVTTILERYSRPSAYPAILDPFCGAGTTLLVAQQRELPAVGVEINPFAAFLSRVKTEHYKIDPEELEKVLEIVINDTNSTKITLPALTTFRNKDYFPNKSAYKLIRLRNSINRLRAKQEVKDALMLALLATIEDVSHLHKDGRLLRYSPKNIISPQEALYKRTMVILEDIKAIRTKPYSKVSVLQGDTRELNLLLSDHQFSCQFGLILYSPPYVNNFDYSEVYKCELWLAGFIESYDQWRKLRKKTFRSHPDSYVSPTSYLKNKPELREVYRLVEQAARCPDIGSYAQKRAPRVIRGYFDDVFLMLQEQIAILAPKGHIVCVVGNSRHGNLHIPADTLIAKIGQALGLELVEICIAKYRFSRNQTHQKLRESLVIFRKP